MKEWFRWFYIFSPCQVCKRWNSIALISSFNQLYFFYNENEWAKGVFLLQCELKVFYHGSKRGNESRLQFFRTLFTLQRWKMPRGMSVIIKSNIRYLNIRMQIESSKFSRPLLTLIFPFYFDNVKILLKDKKQYYNTNWQKWIKQFSYAFN